MQKKTLWMICATLMLALISGGCSDDGKDRSADNISIAFLIPLSGNLKNLGPEQVDAVNMAVSEINDAGGILGKKIEIIPYDTEGNADIATTMANKILNTNAIAVLGPTTSGESIKLIDIFKDAKLPMVSGSATSIELYNIDDNGVFYRTLPADDLQAQVAAEYMLNDLNKKTAGVLYINNIYGEGLANVFKQKFTENEKGEVKGFVPFKELSANEIDTHDFSADVQEVFKGQPEVIYIISYINDGIKITVEASKLITNTYKPIFFGCDGNKDTDFFVNGASTITDGMFGAQPAPNPDSPNYKAFATKFKEKYNRADAGTFTHTIYDAVYLIALAATKGGQPTREAVYNNLRAVSGPNGTKVSAADYKTAVELIKNGENINYEGASGPIDWDANGNVSESNYNIWKLVKGTGGIEAQIIDNREVK